MIMKTISSEYIKEIKAQVRLIKEALKKVQEAEKIQETAVNAREYDKSKAEASDACADMMIALEEAVRLASAMGCAKGLYDIHKYHKIVELDFRDSHNK
jgi:hypothetical protein